ncbi:two-component regulator propeller domain-containing protein [Bacteroidota bacterium]
MKILFRGIGLSWFGFVISVGAVGTLSAQINSWASHTPFRSVKAMTASESAVWVATTGGVFSTELASGEVKRFTTTEGLYGIDVEAIDFDPARNAVWIGYSDGVVDRLDVVGGEVETLLDIKRAVQFASRAINGLRVIGDSVYVSTDFGLVLFDPLKLEVIDSYSNLGSLNPATPVNDALVAPLPDGRSGLWVATTSGLVSADLAAVNLREPSEWTLESSLPEIETLALSWFNGRMHVGTAKDAFARNDDGSWRGLSLSGNSVSGLRVWKDELVAVEPFSVVFLNSGGGKRRIFVGFEGDGLSVNYSAPTSIVEAPDGILWVGDSIEGALILAGIELAADRYWSDQRVVPEGPFFGLFTDLVFDASGSLWASGTRGRGTGFYKYDGELWTAYTERFESALEGRDTFDFIHYSSSGSIWAGSEGDALAEVSPDNTVATYDDSNSTLKVATGTANYIRVRGIASEPDGSVWVVNQFSGTPLNFHSQDGTWTALPALRGDGIPSSLTYDKIFVDGFGQKWILPDAGDGLIVWDTNNTPTETADDRLKYLRGLGSGGRGLPNETVTAWAEDRSGRIWIGTERGLGIYFVPSLVISDDPNANEAVWPIAEDRTGFLLRDVNVHDIAVDAADRKWIASTTGVWLIDPDGTKVLKHFTSDNSPLFSDDVVATAVDNLTGNVYFATDRGLLSYQDDPIEPVNEAQDLFVFPNPVAAGADGSLPTISIEGLVPATDIRITAVDGSLVAIIEGYGGRVRWDGRDRSGAYVPSGVYIVIARGLNDEGIGYGKIAVIR